MSQTSTRRAVLSLVSAACVVGGVAAGFLACISEHVRPVSEGGVSAAPCDGGGPGNFPSTACDPSDNSCPSLSSSCNIDKTKCGDPATCLPMADNKGKTVIDFRLRRLFITAPEHLAVPIIQSSVVDLGVNLDAPSCGELGNGAFSWLLRADTTANTILTGGAPPSADPFGVGYCFYQYTLPVGDAGSIAVGPGQAHATFADGGFSSDPIPLLNVPIFLKPDAGAADPTNVVILPLRNAVVHDATLSADDNCIGSFNAKALNGSCAIDDPSSCSKWHTAGAIGAFITLEDSDKVFVTLTNATLCTLLTQSQPDPVTKGCARDGNGNITAKGDYCSTTAQPGGCQDSFWLSATFAGAAVKINDGSGDPTCQATASDGGVTDAGNDAADATTD